MTVCGPGPKTVILVEPDETSRNASQRALTAAGLDVLCFPDYMGPLQIAESGNRVDLLITAIRLPAGTPHGVSLAAMVHMRRPRLPVLFIADDNILAQMIGDSDAVLVKPFDLPGLVEAAAQLMGETQPAANQSKSN